MFLIPSTESICSNKLLVTPLGTDNGKAKPDGAFDLQMLSSGS